MDIPFEYKTFEYDELPSPTCIRLLWPVKRQGHYVSRSINGVPLIEFSLKASEFGDLPPFDALSYTWGNPKYDSLDTDEYSTQHKHVVAVNSRLFYVSRNLYEALYRLQKGDIASDDIDQRYAPFNKTRLIQAAEEGNLDQVTECLDRGANYRCQDRFGETALHYAAENGYPEIVRILLLKGANPTILDRYGRNPLACCLQRNRRQWQDTAEILRNWDTQNKDKSSTLEYLTQTGRPLWIDAICVNQDDIPERNSQVAMMSQIFGSARYVVAWLGEADDTTEMAWNCFWPGLKSPVLPKEEFRESLERVHAYNRRETIDVEDKSDHTAMSFRELRAIKSLLTRPWFSRTWIIQEVSLAREIKMICAPFEFQWEKIFHLLFVLFGDSESRYFLTHGSPAIKFDRASAGTEILSLFDIRIRTRPECAEAKWARESFSERFIPANQHQQKLSLSALILLTWNFSVSDPRDKMFAMLSLSKPLEGIRADYSKSATEGFTDMGRILIHAEGDDTVHTWSGVVMDDLEPLESLSFVQPQARFQPHPVRLSQNYDRPANLPSWVPTFKRQLISERIYHKRFNSSGDRPAIFYHSQPRILKLDGLIVDTVVELEEHPFLLFERHLTEDNGMESWLRIASRLPSVYPTGGSRIEALWRTLTQHNQNNAKSEAAKGIFWNFLLESMVEHHRKSSSDRYLMLCQVLEELQIGDSSSFLPSASEMMSGTGRLDDKGEDKSSKPRSRSGAVHELKLESYLMERCLMRTEGGYLGISSKETKAKDCVVLLAGGRTPFILRPTGANQFMFIGEAYVHGMMHGECLRGKEYEFRPIEIE